MSRLTEIICATEAQVRDLSLDSAVQEMDFAQVLRECAELEAFRHESENLYERVRALFFLAALCHFHLPERLPSDTRDGLIPYEGYEHLLSRRFEEAIDSFLVAQKNAGPSDAVFSALATAYHRLAFQTLADQVRRSVRSVKGNQWMFRVGHWLDHPLRVRKELLTRDSEGAFPVLHEQTAVRMDLTHSAWSDIFFLGMDYPEGARVLNVSVDLGVRGRDERPRPPVEAFLRVIDEPVLRLTSIDLGATAEITDLAEVFDFARDYLGLLKAAIIASGIIPPGLEGSGQRLENVLERVVGKGLGLELVSNVRGIPKGSRLAVSTNLLGSIISVCMRATGQAASLNGPLTESERRIVAARAILGEWIGGSGGGWQDSGGVWPGMKLIEGVAASEGDPEFGVSRGRLLPRHHVFAESEIPQLSREQLEKSLVLVHGGMAQNVGPILEMVTEKYLLRSSAEWQGRQDAMKLMDEVVAALRDGDIRHLGELTTTNFFGPIQTIVPWASTAFTERLIDRVSHEFGGDFWGFWMLGGMSGGGMGFMFAPNRKQEAQNRLSQLMAVAKTEMERALPFAMQPVVYDFAINENGTSAKLMSGDEALLPPGYYTLMVPQLLRQDRRQLSPVRRGELNRFGSACRTQPELSGVVQDLFDALLPRGQSDSSSQADLASLMEQNGFDRAQHEQIRQDLRNGRIGLAQNRLPATSEIEDVRDDDVTRYDSCQSFADIGNQLLREGTAAVVTLAAGAGTRWTQGAGVAKALHPFCKFNGQHRSFIEVHLAKSRKTGKTAECPIPHIFTTSHLTHAAIDDELNRAANFGYEGPLSLSPGRAIGLRMVPMIRDLRFQWEEMPQQLLDEQQQKVRESLHLALIQWAHKTGEGSDYTDNLPSQCLHPVGHWYEVPNLLRNGVLRELLRERPQLQFLLLHNIDTLGADLDPALLGWFSSTGATLAFEVIPRRVEDRGGGLARVNDRVRLIEGLAMPREEMEFGLRYYNSMTTWIHIDRLLAVFGLARRDLDDLPRVDAAVRSFAARLPTYVTLKDVKKRWGHGQEDLFPVAQFEKLWGDMSAIPTVDCRFVVVPRRRGQQLKDQAQLDGWLRDGSHAWVDSHCAWA